jgi:hypothetical protein
MIEKDKGVTETGIKASNGRCEELLIRVGWPGTEVGILAGPNGPGIYVYKKDLPTLIAKLQEVEAQK